MQYFDRSMRAQVNMLTEVNFGKSALSQLLDQLVVAKVLSYAISHARSPLDDTWRCLVAARAAITFSFIRKSIVYSAHQL
jgi:hypothetical protein